MQGERRHYNCHAHACNGLATIALEQCTAADALGLSGIYLIEMYKERLNVSHFFKDSKVMQSIDVYFWY